MSPNDAARPVRRLPWQVAAWAWLALCVLVAAHQFTFWRSSHFGTDVMALLPQDEQAPEVSRATRQLADQLTRQVVVMIGAPDWASAQKAADAWQHAIDGAQAPLKTSALAGADALRDTMAFYAPYRDRLLTPRDPNLAKFLVRATLAGDHDVQTVRIDEARGDVTQIRFAHQQPSTALTPDEAARFR